MNDCTFQRIFEVVYYLKEYKIIVLKVLLSTRICLSKVKNENTRTMCRLYSKLTLETLTSQNGQNHSKNLSATADELF